MELNPALTGAFNGSFRVTAGYRDQWSGYINSPYLTIGTYGDFRFNLGDKLVSNGDFVGVGLSFVADRTAFFNINTNQLSVSGAFHKMLNKYNNSYLSGGISLGIVQRSLNYENLTFQDQFNGLDQYSFATQEIFVENNFAHTDFNIGLNYSVTPSKYSSVFITAAMHHVVEPNVSLYDRNADLTEFYEGNPLYRRYLIAVSTEIGFNELTAILPRILYQQQGPHALLNFGTQIKFDINDHNDNAMQFGGGVRMANEDGGLSFVAAYAQVGFVFENLLIGLSYDFNLDDLLNERFGQNALEISISYIGDYENDNGFCPIF